MSNVEYKVVPAPRKGVKAKGIKGPDAQFANAIEGIMNGMAVEGWQYQRAETLPNDTRSGLNNLTTTYRHVLVFSRAVSADKNTAEIAGETAPITAPIAPPHDPPITAHEPVVGTISEQQDPIDGISGGDQTRL